jgi:aminopeptidase-like protein
MLAVSSPLPIDAALDTGKAMHALVRRLYPYCRSITGAGIRQTLNDIADELPLHIEEVPTGTRVFDWTVPREWNIVDAYIKNADGERVVDFQRSNLHVVGYSVPIHQVMTLDELRPHLFTDEAHPDWIPYRTSYYKETWGFCLSQRQLQAMRDGHYEVCIESSLRPGHLTYGELLLHGATHDEVLISCHACHPSLCNDNLSGIATAVFLARALQDTDTRYTYRFLFLPGMIGPITWLALNQDRLDRIKHGLVLACIGDAGHSTYKRSRFGNATIDRAVEHVLSSSNRPYKVIDFSPYGYDERQYCSPGINLPVGCLMRTPHGQFPEYHTSADNLNLVQPEALADSLAKCIAIVDVLEGNQRYVNLNPRCEPQLGRRGLYASTGGANHAEREQLALLWVLNLSDGDHALLDIAERAHMPFTLIRHAADELLAAGLLCEAADSVTPILQ